MPVAVHDNYVSMVSHLECKRHLDTNFWSFNNYFNIILVLSIFPGCSPSPCESLTSSGDTQEQQAEEDALNGESRKDQSSPAGQLRDYLQSFDRRKSDSNYVLGTKNNPSNTEEKMDLVDEIKRLSDHLTMLNTMKTEMEGEKAVKATPKEATDAPAKKSPSQSVSPTGSTKLSGSGAEKRTPRMKLTDPANLSSKLESKIVKSHIMRFSNTSGESTSQVTTKSSQQMASSSSVVNNTSSFHFARSLSSVRTATRLIEEQHSPQTPISQPPWMLKCKRTKFRMTELSRDVPQNAPESHKNIRIEEAANSTKDCLLQLLEKYNGNAEDEFTKRCLDIDRSVIPPSSSSSSSSIASLPPMDKSKGSSSAKSGKVTQMQTSSAVSSSTNNTGGQTVTKTVRRTTKTTTTNSSSSTTATTRMHEEFMDNTMDAELEGKAGQTEFAKSIPRHLSLSLKWDKDSPEENSMNSINAFFQRHSSHVGSSAVRQIQQQIEAKRVPQQ